MNNDDVIIIGNDVRARENLDEGEGGNNLYISSEGGQQQQQQYVSLDRPPVQLQPVIGNRQSLPYPQLHLLYPFYLQNGVVAYGWKK